MEIDVNDSAANFAEQLSTVQNGPIVSTYRNNQPYQNQNKNYGTTRGRGTDLCNSVLYNFNHVTNVKNLLI